MQFTELPIALQPLFLTKLDEILADLLVRKGDEFLSNFFKRITY